MREDSYFKEILSLSATANMRPAPPTVSPHEPASTVMDLMTRKNVEFVLIVENNHSVGVVTEKDMLRAIKSKKIDGQRVLSHPWALKSCLRKANGFMYGHNDVVV